MRKVLSALFISLDGVVESPNLWQFDHFDADMLEGMAKVIDMEDTMLLGRVTYQDWAPFWPTSSDEPYASHINNTFKIVISTTLGSVEWGQFDNISLINENFEEEINKLKLQSGKNIGVGGSPSLVRSLIQKNLLDELTLMIHPVIVGQGKRLFTDNDSLKRMKLINSQITRTGVALLTYQPLEPATPVIRL